MIRVLIVDDEPTIRLGMRNILESDKEIKVVGEARNGLDAIRLCKQLKPDVVTMDIIMPGMSGYDAISHIMDESPCPIIVVTSIDSAGIIDVSFKALELGALSVLQKPKSLNLESPEVKSLIEHIKNMAGVKVVRRNASLLAKPPMRDMAKTKNEVPLKYVFPSRALKKVRLIAVGASTGGPPAIQKILCELPAGFTIPIVVVQHISPGFVSGMADWLSSSTKLNCKVGKNGELIKPGTVYLAPDDSHLTVSSNNSLLLDYSAPIGGHRPSVNMLFESVAKHFDSEAVGVLLTGMGQDGAQGLKSMHDAGAYTIAQDEASSVVFGMPGTAVRINAVDEVLNLDLIAAWFKGMTERLNN